jgi:DNA-binding MarR family transcriptional regulator
MSSGSEYGAPLVGAMTRRVWQSVWQEIFVGVAAAGFDDVNPAHVGLFRYPGLDRQRPTELADQLQITKQSVNDLLGHLEHHGYLIREPDPNDGRARLVRLTAKGHKLQKTIHGQAQASEERIAATLGARRYAQFRQALEDLTRLGPQDKQAAPRS